jgi:transcription termination/antitermination protein NusA
VGACVGMKGMRVQSIIRELRGEKIDIIEYSDDAVVFATHALSPAKISRVTIVDASGKHMEVIVDDSQLSLAIGKKGQNVRLAAKLLGWRIDIKSEEEKRQEVESQMAALVAPGAPVSVLIDFGLGEKLAEKLVEADIGTVEKLGGMTPEQLEEIQGIGPKMVERIQEAVNAYYSQFETAEAGAEGAPAAEAEAGAEGAPIAEAEAEEAVAAEEQASSPEMEVEAAEEAALPAETEGVAGEPAAVEPGPAAEDEVAHEASEQEAEAAEGGGPQAESDTIKDLGLETGTHER